MPPADKELLLGKARAGVLGLKLLVFPGSWISGGVSLPF